MALRKFLILRRPRRGRLEGRTTLIQAIVDFLTPSFAEATRNGGWEPFVRSVPLGNRGRRL